MHVLYKHFILMAQYRNFTGGNVHHIVFHTHLQAMYHNLAMCLLQWEVGQQVV